METISEQVRTMEEQLLAIHADAVEAGVKLDRFRRAQQRGLCPSKKQDLQRCISEQEKKISDLCDQAYNILSSYLGPVELEEGDDDDDDDDDDEEVQDWKQQCEHANCESSLGHFNPETDVVLPKPSACHRWVQQRDF